MRSVTRLALGIALAASLTGCGSSDAELFAAAVIQATETALPAAFAELKFEHQSPATSPTPALVFDGRPAVMLSVSEPALRGNFFKEVHLDVLARSQGAAGSSPRKRRRKPTRRTNTFKEQPMPDDKKLMGAPLPNPGYHLVAINKGELGELSKIQEELDELKDAMAQGSRIMAAVELADLVGAIDAFLTRHLPGITLDDLRTFSAITQRAFQNGRRQSH